MPTPSISLRKHIRWPPAPASEPTSTLVLTSQASHFVDVRLLIPEPNGNPASASNISTKPFEALDWAFAGTSATTPSPRANPDTPAHTLWTHLIDSQTPDAPETVRDKGDIFPQANGDSLETGSMINPATGEVAAYEELWTELEVPPSLHFSVVLKTRTKNWEGGERGMIVRVGGWCQGILTDTNGRCTIERWRFGGHDCEEEYSSERGEAEAYIGNWKRVARLGEATLPCVTTFGEFDLREGETVNETEERWIVVESSGW
ncbi:MAG: hypothetical protein M1812_003289 [Candelaria pacifica]|nr:MAG: hypothetical protein M1812_003289 [Candelaria pacifica]